MESKKGKERKKKNSPERATAGGEADEAIGRERMRVVKLQHARIESRF